MKTVESEFLIDDKAASFLFYQNFADTNWDLFMQHIKV